MVQDSIIIVRSGRTMVLNSIFVVGSGKYVWYEIVINNMIRKVMEQSDCKLAFRSPQSRFSKGVPNV